MPPLQGGKAGAGFHKPRVKTLGWFVKALQAYIDTVWAVREPPIPTMLHSNLTINEPFIARMFANSCAQLLCQRGEIVIECSLIGYWLLY